MVWPIETWPSPARATRPLWRTHTTVVAWNVSGSCGATSVGPGMRGVVHLHQMLGADVRVTLRRAEPAVAQELLDEAQVRPLAQHVRGEGVPERVGSHAPVDAGGAGPPPHDAVDAPRGQAASARVGEERPPRFAAHGEPGIHGVEGLVSHGDDALLAALAHDADGALPPVDVVAVEAAAFGHAQPRGVEQLEDGSVAEAGRGALGRAVEELLGLVLGQERGQARGELGAAHLP